MLTSIITLKWHMVPEICSVYILGFVISFFLFGVGGGGGGGGGGVEGHFHPSSESSYVKRPCI